MKKRGYWIKQSIAIMISVAMLFSSVELPALAEEAEKEEMTESVEAPKADDAGGCNLFYLKSQ